MPDRAILHILLAGPRGFCAGVDRAIKIVEQSLNQWGAPIYVRHEIVHNRTVVKRLEALGAVFVDELDQCPDDRPVVFSAHGVPARIPAQARARGLKQIDATCPLVSKVHAEARHLYQQNRHILLIGHAGHPEVEGSMGQVPDGAVTLIETLKDVENLVPPAGQELAYLTQTTLSVDDTAEIIAALKSRFPDLHAPPSADICYATSNRQNAVRAIAARADLVLIVGSDNSSNARRLVEVARKSGAKAAYLVADAEHVDWTWFDGVKTLGISAGASTPETLVSQLVAACRARFSVTLEDVCIETESVVFRLPRELETTL